MCIMWPPEIYDFSFLIFHQISHKIFLLELFSLCYSAVSVKLPISRRNYVPLTDAEKGQIHSNRIVKISVLAPPTLVYLPLTKQPELCNELRKHKMK